MAVLGLVIVAVLIAVGVALAALISNMAVANKRVHDELKATNARLEKVLYEAGKLDQFMTNLVTVNTVLGVDNSDVASALHNFRRGIESW